MKSGIVDKGFALAIFHTLNLHILGDLFNIYSVLTLIKIGLG